jgi:hypothetical protein
MIRFYSTQNLFSKTFLLTIVLFLATNASSWAQTIPTFATDTAGKVFHNRPFNNRWRGSAQYVFTPGAFKDANNNVAKSGYISSIYFFVETGQDTHTYHNMYVGMLQDTSTGFYQSKIWHQGKFTECLNRTYHIMGAKKDKWVKIDLDVPFKYDSTKTLVIEFDKDEFTGNGFRRGIRAYNQRTVTNTRLSGTFRSSLPDALDNYRLVMGFDLQSDNDLSVVSVDSPSITCYGLQDVYATVANLGKNDVTKFTLNWEIAGVKQTPVTYSSKLKAPGNGNNYVQIKLGQADLSTHPELKVYASGISDGNKKNDTLIHQYPFNPTGRIYVGFQSKSDFLYLQLLFDYLENHPICSPVEVILTDATIDQRCQITPVKGSSMTNTITIKSPHVDSLLWINTRSRAQIHIQGADNIIFENIRFKLDNRPDAIGIRLSDTAENITITNCEFTSDTVVKHQNLACIAACNYYTDFENSGNGINVNNLTITNCKFTGGGYSLFVSGESKNKKVENVFVNNCTFSKSNYGFWGNYIDNLIITNCEFGKTKSVSYTNNIGNSINLKSCDNFSIYANYLRGPVFIKNANNGLNASSRYFNNAQHVSLDSNYINTFTSATSIVSSSNIDFYHNGIIGQVDTILGINSSKRIDIRNNILARLDFKNGACLAVNAIADNAPDLTGWNHNCYYSNTKPTRMVRYNDSTLNKHEINGIWDLKSFSQANLNGSFNELNWNEDPRKWWDNENSQHLKKSFPRLFGDDLQIASDIDGNDRCKLLATIGVDEFNDSVVYVNANIGTDLDTIYLHTPFKAYYNGNKSNVMAFTWYVNGVVLSDSNELNYTPNNIGLDTFVLIAENCNDADTVISYINVVLPTRRPVANFVVSKKTANPNELIIITDASLYGPSTWRYKITDENGKPFVLDTTLKKKTNPYIFENDDSTNYQVGVRFKYPGYYNIELVVTNQHGKDSLLKRNEILINDSLTIGGKHTKSTAPTGTLFDDGGAYLDYSSTAGISTFTIGNCKGNLILNLEELNLNIGESLRIYDGVDSSMNPLWDDALFPKGITENIFHPSYTPVFICETGYAYIVFKNNGDNSVNDGFKLKWFTDSTGWQKPKITISYNDSSCIRQDVKFNIAHPKLFNFISWDFLVNDTINSFSDNLTRSFNKTGKYAYKVKTNSLCWGPDSIIDTVEIFKTSQLPIPSFRASKVSVVTNDTFTLFSNPDWCTYKSTWDLGTSNYKLRQQTTLNSPVVVLSMGRQGIYDISLEEENSTGIGITQKKEYIKVYCSPGVKLTESSSGITQVDFNTISNKSKGGEDAFTDYSDLSTTVIKGRYYPVSIRREFSGFPINRYVWIDFNQDADFDDAGELVLESLSKNGKVLKDSIFIPLSATTGYTRVRVGSSIDKVKNACEIIVRGEFEDYSVRIVDKDTVPPLITLTNGLIDSVEVFNKWVDPGYKAFDDVDGDVTHKVTVKSNVNTSIVGSYTVSYSVIDKEKNQITINRIVRVVDLTKPQVFLNGSDIITMHNGESFNDPGAYATDNYYKNVAIDITGKVDTSSVGTYLVNYCATDSSGNGPACITRSVVVIDTVRPMLTTNGVDTVFAEQCDSLIEPKINITETDTYKITFAGSFENTNKVGDFTRIYIVKDKAGNTSSITRTISVRDTKKPSIALKGSSFDTIPRWSTYIDSGVVVSDDCETPSTIDLTTGGDFIGTQSAGLFRKTYQATDASGNKSEEIHRIILVEEGNGVKTVSNFRLQVYPNPFNEGLRISSEFEITTIEILSADGKLVYQQTTSNQKEVQLNTMSISDGLYFVKVVTANGTSITRIVKG